MQKETVDDTDDNTLIQKMTAPIDNVQVDDSQLILTAALPSNMQWGGYDTSGVWHDAGWLWGTSGYWG